LKVFLESPIQPLNVVLISDKTSQSRLEWHSTLRMPNFRPTPAKLPSYSYCVAGHSCRRRHIEWQALASSNHGPDGGLAGRSGRAVNPGKTR
jgi:hypothetical protein